METQPTYNEFYEAILGKLQRHFGRTLADCTETHLFKAVALTLRDELSKRMTHNGETQTATKRELHYLSFEFLLGRSLEKNAFNLGYSKLLREVTDDLCAERAKLRGEECALSFSDFFEEEPDAGLGNGGLGRLAACYIDSMTTLDLPATGYSLCYEYGIFKQKIIDGAQVELPDPWLEVSDCWLIPHTEDAVSVRFGGHLEERWIDGRLEFEHLDYSEVLAVPKDMLISGFGTQRVNTLRLWESKSANAIDFKAFSGGEYMKALEQHAMASVITKVLYPEDNHFEGKLLRLRQQYFFVSATVQSIVRKHKTRHRTLENFHNRHCIHINDTHPALVIPELMRVLIDEEKYSWDKAWSITCRTVAYTNHTVMSEALECWPQNVIEMLLPRIWQILCEINDRYVTNMRNDGFSDVFISKTAVIWDGQVRMANLCVLACFTVNGVSELHSNILRNDIFKYQFELTPQKFLNVTNGIDHRRWLTQVNPELHELLHDTIGDSYMSKPSALSDFSSYADDKTVLSRLSEIKNNNKIAFSRYLYKSTGTQIDPSFIFDAQVKRLHEYKRQLLNILHVLSLYNRIKDDSSFDMQPRVFFFGAKAAPGYGMAKRIIRLIGSVANHIARDPVVSKYIKVIFLENYRVSVAEKLMPATEVSEQISIAGKEASGTGNMKFMINGALTIGTLDGANVEISAYVGTDNIFLFGLTVEDVEKLHRDGYYPASIYSQNSSLRRVLDMLSNGLSDGVEYSDIVQSLLMGGNRPADPYMVLADFESYCNAQQTVQEKYRRPGDWNRSSLLNISSAGAFAADRSISQYAQHIWNI